MASLLNIRNRCKQESDNVGQSFLSDTEWDSLINSSYQELYGLIVEAFGNDYFTQTPATGFSITTTGTTQFFALPSDFFKLLGVDLQISSPSQWVSLDQFPFSARNSLSAFNSSIPAAGQVLRVFYVPTVTLLSGDASILDGVNGWEEYVIIDAALKAMAKEESDVSVLMTRKQAILARLAAEIENRDANDNGRIADTRGRSARGMRYRLNGGQLWLIGNAAAWPGGWGYPTMDEYDYGW